VIISYYNESSRINAPQIHPGKRAARQQRFEQGYIKKVKEVSKGLDDDNAKEIKSEIIKSHNVRQ
jgi:hypothetical protein